MAAGALDGVFTCLDADTGEVLYTEQRLEGISNVYASPVAAGGRIYVFGRDGQAIVLAGGREYRVVATNSLDDEIDASPAIVGDEIFVRGARYLYALSSHGGRVGPRPGLRASPPVGAGGDPQ